MKLIKDWENVNEIFQLHYHTLYIQISAKLDCLTENCESHFWVCTFFEEYDLDSIVYLVLCQQTYFDMVKSMHVNSSNLWTKYMSSGMTLCGLLESYHFWAFYCLHNLLLWYGKQIPHNMQLDDSKDFSVMVAEWLRNCTKFKIVFHCLKIFKGLIGKFCRATFMFSKWLYFLWF
jgi:hypothetical protein